MTMAKHAGSVLSLFLFGVRLTIGQNSTTDVGGSELNVDGTPDIDESPEEAEEMDEIINENRRISVEGEAFLLVIAAGLCTAIGACTLFRSVCLSRHCDMLSVSVRRRYCIVMSSHQFFFYPLFLNKL